MRIANRILILGILLAVFPAALLSAGGAPEAGDRIRLEGRVEMAGSMPLTKVVLVTPEGGEYVLDGPLAEELAMNHQLQQVVVIGRLVSDAEGARKPVVEVIRFRKG